MRKATMMSFLVLVVATVMLSGCIYPYWDYGYDGRGGDGYRGYEGRGGDGYRGDHDNGRRGR